MERYELVATGDAEVVPGPLSRIREACERAAAVGRQVDPAEILAILDKAQR